jgi:hypothetical protein
VSAITLRVEEIVALLDRWARYPRLDMARRLVLLSSLAICTALAGCASVVQRPTPIVPLQPGIVTGGIERCYALPHSGPAEFVAGTVDLFRGARPTSQPAAAEQAVTQGGQYRFSVQPGEYVLVAHWAGTNLPFSPVTVAVASGTTMTQNLQYNGCM